jgi:hypothetical protein
MMGETGISDNHEQSSRQRNPLNRRSGVDRRSGIDRRMEDLPPPDGIERRQHDSRRHFLERRSGNDRRLEAKQAMRKEISNMCILPSILKPLCRWLRRLQNRIRGGKHHGD